MQGSTTGLGLCCPQLQGAVPFHGSILCKEAVPQGPRWRSSFGMEPCVHAGSPVPGHSIGLWVRAAGSRDCSAGC